MKTIKIVLTVVAVIAVILFAIAMITLAGRLCELNDIMPKFVEFAKHIDLFGIFKNAELSKEIVENSAKAVM